MAKSTPTQKKPDTPAEHIPGDAAVFLGKPQATADGSVMVDLGGGEKIDLSKPAPDPFETDPE